MVELPNMSGRARDLREMLLTQADVGEAADVAAQISNKVVELLNGSMLTVATHILTAALIARATTEIAADWWATDFGPHPVEDTSAALLSIQLDMPAGLKGGSFDTREDGQ
jgi:hypothetical protein